jgi:dCTP diphosphatase
MSSFPRSDRIENLAARLRDFAARRNWERFHSPKNLAMAVSAEAGELLAELQWLSEDESRRSAMSEDQLAAVSEEIADVFIYLVRLADVLDLDLVAEAERKIQINEQRFPAETQANRSD